MGDEPGSDFTTHIPEKLWAKLAPLCDRQGSAAPPKRKATGRPKADQRKLMGQVVHKLRSGIGWNVLGKSGTTAHALYKRLAKAGHWPAVWRHVVAEAQTMNLTKAELTAATAWLIAMKAIDGPPDKWVKGAGRLIADLEKRQAKKTREYGNKPKVKAGPKQKRVAAPEALWSIPDDLWAEIRPIIDERLPRFSRGKERTNERVLLDGILFQLRTGIQWKAMGNMHGVHYATLHRWMVKFHEAGVFRELQEMLILSADAKGLVDWGTQVIDGSLQKSRRGGEVCGPNPADRGKTGIKWSLLVEGHGYPLSVVVASANTPDRSLLKETLEKRIKRPDDLNITPTLLADRGYSGHKAQGIVEAAGYEFRAPPRDKGDPYALLDVPLSRVEREKRARIERTNAWLQNYRVLVVRYGRKKKVYEAQLGFACALLWWGRLNQKITNNPKAA